MSVTIDITVDAFVFNREVCDGPDTRIAPITQPNYDFLSLQQEKVRADVLDSHELHYALPAETNSRLVDIGTGEIRANRVGVYIHWILPTSYRTGEEAVNEELQKRRTGKQRNEGDAVATPDFKPVPNRWLVIRRIKTGTMVPADAPVPEVEGWIVESDRLWDVSELHDEVDTQIDVSPFVSAEAQGQAMRNGRDFLGYKTSALGWQESEANRANLTIMSSSNQLFADYQPHNGNVFSICDNFAYKVGDQTKYVESCDASYLVFGWHSDEHQDPLHLSRAQASIPKLRDLLNIHHIHLVGEEPTTLSQDSDTWTLLQGAIHGVKWSVHQKPATIPADEAAALFKDPHNLPIAVGAGPLDALLTYIQSHDDLDEVEQLILKIQTLLISQEDGVDEQNAAEDVLRDTSYDGVDGGITWHLSGNESDDVLPPNDSLAALRQANAIQAKLDTLQRTLPTLQWEMFSYWWKFLCDHGKDQNLDTIKGEVSALSARIANLVGEGSNSIYYDLPKLINEMLQEQVKLPSEPAAAGRFYQCQDPTLLIAGLVSGWPKGHINETNARLSADLKKSESAQGTAKSSSTLLDELIAVMPSDLRPSTTEFATAFLNTGDTGNNSDEQPAWTKQPWCPLFLEWEGEYFHIPLQHWRMDRYQANSSSTLEHIRWGIKSETDLSTLPEVRDNFRKISGRELLLPQPGFSLGSKVDQLFTNVPEGELDEYISKQEREELVDHLANSFPYMSCTLSGFTNHLLTLQQGTHVNPNQRLPGSETVEPTQGAIELTAEIGLGEAELRQVGIQSETTPYANQVSGLPTAYAAFKPATHGQFRFTKIDIIDKFGQAISVIDQTPAQQLPRIYPCISELFSVQRLQSGDPNTVIPDDTGGSEFIQISPRINHPTRLNAHFMVEDPSEGWRPADDWENPIFGWLLINFANYGLQVFLPDGSFYREIRLGGASGATASEPWLPFAPPNPPPKVNEELDRFIEALQNQTNMQGVYQLILDAFQHTQEVPDSYAEFLSALVGKPVALTNVGFSLELDTAEKKDQTVYTAGEVHQPEPSVLTYELPLKIGDQKRVYDGLVGYFEPGNPEKIYTYFNSQSETSTLTAPIDATTYPTLQPFFINATDTAPQNYIKSRNAELLRRVALLDPFVALHAYTGLSPVAEIKLPNWTVETALKQMTAFFHLGPICATKDVPAFDAAYKLTASYGGDVEPYPGKGLVIPAGLKKEEWIWLQPYANGADQSVLEFMALNIDAAEQRVRWEPAPYTAVEGYLQLKQAVGGKPSETEQGRRRAEVKEWTGVGTGWIH